MEGGNTNQQQQQQVPSADGFQLGRSAVTELDKKKKKLENHAEERIKQTFNLAGSAKEQEDLKRKREEYAV